MTTVTFDIVWEWDEHASGTNPAGAVFDPPIADLSALSDYLTYDSTNQEYLRELTNPPGSTPAGRTAASVDGTVTLDILNFHEGTELGRDYTFYARGDANLTGFIATVNWALPVDHGSEALLPFAPASDSGNVADGLVRYNLSSLRVQSRLVPPRQPYPTATFDLLRGDAVFATIESAVDHLEPYGSKTFVVPPGDYPSGDPPALFGDFYFQYYTVADEVTTNAGAMHLDFPLYEVRTTTLRTRLNSPAHLEDSIPVHCAAVPIVQISQDDHLITDGLWNYAGDMDGFLQLKHDIFPLVEQGTVRLDATTSYSPTDGTPDTFLWRVASPGVTPGSVVFASTDGGRIYFDTSAADTTALVFADGSTSGERQFGLTLTTGGGLTTTFVPGVKFEPRSGSAVATPNGEVLLPVAVDFSHTNIVRVEPTGGMAVVAERTWHNVALMRHQSILYAGVLTVIPGDPSGLLASYDGGVNWVFVAPPAEINRVLDYCMLEHGGIAVIGLGGAADNRKLYGSVSWDFTNWSPPTLQRDGGDTAPKAKLAQLNASGESTLVITDGTSYVVTVHDFFENPNPDPTGEGEEEGEGG